MKNIINTINNAFDIELPSFYTDALINYPFPSSDDPDCIEGQLVKDLDWLIKTNRKLREDGFCYQDYWPNHFFAIGFDGFGNYYFINLLQQDTSIYIADHEEDFNHKEISNMELASNIEEYINDCLEE
ncbi:hypothetical protein Misp06_04482 [Microbulbifer sp. NBRC 101763]|uniref:SMI1/KNR4 family protein n=1 Tax=unclassified Microbulbifer TaxID=2619833 RepID=UPI0030AF8C30